MTGSINWIPLIGEQWWQMSITQATYNGVSFLVNANSAIVDSGTSLLAMPSADFNNLIGMMNTQIGGLICEGVCYSQLECSAIQPLVGELTFAFGTSATFVATPSQYLIDGSYFNNPNTCYLGF